MASISALFAGPTAFAASARGSARGGEEIRPSASCTYSVHKHSSVTVVDNFHCSYGTVAPWIGYYRNDNDPRLQTLVGQYVKYGSSSIARPGGTLYGGGGAIEG